MPHGCQFNDIWLADPNFKSWIKRNEKDPYSADCKLCKTSIFLKTMGRTALTSHMKGKKHNDLLKFHSQSKDLGFFLKPKNETTQATALSSMPSASSAPEVSVPSHDSATFKVSSSETLKAEIWWSVRCAMKNHSFSSNSDLGFYLQKMFPDIPSVSALSLGETKSMYLTVYGLAPHFRSVLLEDLKSEPYCILFDESLNKSTMSKQLDVHVRYWSGDAVKTRYVDSFMLGHATAQDLVDNLNNLKQDLNFANLLQISMDGPNVNWSAYNKFTKQLAIDYGNGLVNIGSCGLHQVHNSYRSAVSETGWNMDHFLTSIYYLFKDVPARREDYTKETKSSEFPLKFAAHRWVENQRVMRRAKDILLYLQQYIDAVKNKKVKDPKSQPFTTTVKFLEDGLLKAKLVFLISMCKPLETFLTVYQQDAPLIPFLFDDLNDLVKKMMKKIVKPSVMEGKEVREIEVTEGDNLMNYTKIKIGIETEEVLKEQQKISQKQIMEFRIECLKFIQTFLRKILNKSPLNYSFTQNLASLSPKTMCHNPSTSKTMFKKVILQMKDLNFIRLDELDDIMDEYDHLIDEAKVNVGFKDFDHRKDAVDKIFSSTCKGNIKYGKLWPILKKLLVLSHGQASVERGFSFNKEVLETNMQKKTLVGKRLVKDYILSVGGIKNFSISPELLKSCSLAYSRYSSSLRLQKEKEETTRGEKRKALEDSISELKKRKVIIGDTAKALETESDDKGDRAEKEKNLRNQVVLFSQANALRKAAKEKTAELRDIEKTLEEKVSQLSRF